MHTHLRIMTLAALAVLACMAVAPFAMADEKKIVAVVPFDAVGGHDSWGESAATYLETLLVETGKFRVVERKRLDRILKEHELGQTGLTAMAKTLGNFVEVDFLLGGSITPLGDSFSLNAKLIDIETAELTVAKSTTFKDINQLRKACNIVVKALGDRVYGTGDGNSKSEIFGMSDSRHFYDAANLVIGHLQAVTSNVKGTVDEVSGSKVYLQVEKAIGYRDGIKVAVESEGFEGTDDAGALYVTKYRKDGRSEAAFLEPISDLQMGMAFSSAKYKNVVAVGAWEDVEEENGEFLKQWEKLLKETMGSSEGVVPADGVDRIVSEINSGNMTAKLKMLFKKGVDIFATGRFLGSAGSRRLDLIIYNCYDGKKIKTMTVETRL